MMGEITRDGGRGILSSRGGRSVFGLKRHSRRWIPLGPEMLERRSLLAGFTFLTPGGLGVSIDGQSMQTYVTADNGGGGVNHGGGFKAGAVTVGSRLGFLTDAYPLGPSWLN